MIQTGHLISARRPDLVLIEEKKNEEERTCRTVDFTVLADHRMKIKEYEKRDKYLDLAIELIKLWGIEVTVIPIVVGALGMVPKDSVRGPGRVENRRMNRD